MKVQDIIIWILFILTLLVVLWYILGTSPTFEQAILILILTILIANTANTREIKIRLKLLESSFVRLAKDFKYHIHINNIEKGEKWKKYKIW